MDDIALSFVKFAVLATAGELLGMRISSGRWTFKGVVPRMLVWGVLGVCIGLAMKIFAAGVPAVLGASLSGPLTWTKVGTAAAVSVAMNTIFAPVFMTFHRVTDIHISRTGGTLRGFFGTGLKMGETLQGIDWRRQWGFVFARTIPLFWYPAHTVTFLLPTSWRVLFAAFLGVMLGVLLSACSPDEPTPTPDPYTPLPIEPVSQDSVLLAGKYYLPRALEYYDGFYDFIGKDCVVLHLEFIIDGTNPGAGMTVEISRELLGQTIEIAPSDKFWFFHVGTGRSYVMLQNDDTPFKEDYTGHFLVDLDGDKVFFEWQLSGTDGIVTEGLLNEPFQRLEQL